MWTERLNRADWLETMTYPWLCALAEVAWSPKAARDWEQFSQRMETHLQRLAVMGVMYSRADKAEPKLADSRPDAQPAATPGQ